LIDAMVGQPSGVCLRATTRHDSIRVFFLSVRGGYITVELTIASAAGC